MTNAEKRSRIVLETLETLENTIANGYAFKFTYSAPSAGSTREQYLAWCESTLGDDPQLVSYLEEIELHLMMQTALTNKNISSMVWDHLESEIMTICQLLDAETGEVIL